MRKATLSSGQDGRGAVSVETLPRSRRRQMTTTAKSPGRHPLAWNALFIRGDAIDGDPSQIQMAETILDSFNKQIEN